MKIFQFLWVFEFFEKTQKQNKKSKINNNKKLVKETCYKQKTIHDMMHEPMILSIGSIDAWT